MLKHSVFYRVCYADTDQMGYVYYGNYARFYEIARVETLRHIGVSYKVLEEAGIGLPVYENYSKFHAPALYDDFIRIIHQNCGITWCRFFDAAALCRFWSSITASCSFPKGSKYNT